MVQKARRSDSSSQNSLSPCTDWLEVRGEGLLGTVLDSVAEQSSLGDESVEKAHFVDFAPLSKAEP